MSSTSTAPRPHHLTPSWKTSLSSPFASPGPGARPRRLRRRGSTHSVVSQAFSTYSLVPSTAAQTDHPRASPLSSDASSPTTESGSLPLPSTGSPSRSLSLFSFVGGPHSSRRRSSGARERRSKKQRIQDSSRASAKLAWKEMKLCPFSLRFLNGLRTSLERVQRQARKEEEEESIGLNRRSSTPASSASSSASSSTENEIDIIEETEEGEGEGERVALTEPGPTSNEIEHHRRFSSPSPKRLHRSLSSSNLTPNRFRPMNLLPPLSRSPTPSTPSISTASSVSSLSISPPSSLSVLSHTTNHTNTTTNTTTTAVPVFEIPAIVGANELEFGFRSIHAKEFRIRFILWSTMMGLLWVLGIVMLGSFGLVGVEFVVPIGVVVLIPFGFGLVLSLPFWSRVEMACVGCGGLVRSPQRFAPLPIFLEWIAMVQITALATGISCFMYLSGIQKNSLAILLPSSLTVLRPRFITALLGSLFSLLPIISFGVVSSLPSSPLRSVSITLGTIAVEIASLFAVNLLQRRSRLFYLIHLRNSIVHDLLKKRTARSNDLLSRILVPSLVGEVQEQLRRQASRGRRKRRKRRIRKGRRNRRRRRRRRRSNTDLSSSLIMVVRSFKSAVVIQLDVVKFTELAGRILSRNLVTFLDDVYTTFGEECLRFGFVKTKTIGDCFICVNESAMARSSSSSDEIDPEGLCQRAMLLSRTFRSHLEEIDLVTESGERISVSIRIGVALDKGLVSCVGLHRLALDLHGSIAVKAARLEQNCPPDGTMVSEAVASMLPTSKWRLSEAIPIEDPFVGVFNGYVVHRIRSNRASIVSIEPNRENSREEMSSVSTMVSIDRGSVYTSNTDEDEDPTSTTLLGSETALKLLLVMQDKATLGLTSFLNSRLLVLSSWCVLACFICIGISFFLTESFSKKTHAIISLSVGGFVSLVHVFLLLFVRWLRPSRLENRTVGILSLLLCFITVGTFSGLVESVDGDAMLLYEILVLFAIIQVDSSLNVHLKCLLLLMGVFTFSFLRAYFYETTNADRFAVGLYPLYVMGFSILSLVSHSSLQRAALLCRHRLHSINRIRELELVRSLLLHSIIPRDLLRHLSRGLFHVFKKMRGTVCFINLRGWKDGFFRHPDSSVLYLKILGDLFGRFDETVNSTKSIFKVRSLSDTYVLYSLDCQPGALRELIEVLASFLAETSLVFSRNASHLIFQREPFSIAAGLASGDFIGCVIGGKHRPCFDIYGPVVNQAARCLVVAQNGTAVMTSSTLSLVPDCVFQNTDDLPMVDDDDEEDDVMLDQQQGPFSSPFCVDPRRHRPRRFSSVETTVWSRSEKKGKRGFPSPIPMKRNLKGIGFVRLYSLQIPTVVD